MVNKSPTEGAQEERLYEQVHSVVFKHAMTIS